MNDFEASLRISVRNIEKDPDRVTLEKNPIDCQTTVKFKSDNNVWGNAKFIPIKYINYKDIGETLRIEFSIVIQRPNPITINGASGLINGGSTCYKNCILQGWN